MYEIVIEKSQKRRYATLDSSMQTRIAETMQELKTIPEPTSHPKAKPMRGPQTGLFRVRVGDYRIVVERDMNQLKIHKLGERGSVYDDMNELYGSLDA